VQAAGADAHRGGTVTVAGANPPTVYEGGIANGLDPASGYAEDGLLMVTNDGLVGYDRSAEGESARVVPDLAVSLPTVRDGGLPCSYHLPGNIHDPNSTMVCRTRGRRHQC
jgi:hypothetical protein